MILGGGGGGGGGGGVSPAVLASTTPARCLCSLTSVTCDNSSASSWVKRVDSAGWLRKAVRQKPSTPAMMLFLFSVSSTHSRVFAAPLQRRLRSAFN